MNAIWAPQCSKHRDTKAQGSTTGGACTLSERGVPGRPNMVPARELEPDRCSVSGRVGRAPVPGLAFSPVIRVHCERDQKVRGVTSS